MADYYGDKMTRSELQEILCMLYLRLNGYLTTSLIVHSSIKNKNLTQVDIIGVRFPFHKQQERNVNSSPYLKIPENTIDIVICEVKGSSAGIQFNDPLKSNEQALELIFKWIGAITPKNYLDIKHKLKNLFSSNNIDHDNFPEVITQLGSSNVSIRAILFAPDRQAVRPNQRYFVHGREIMAYIHQCVHGPDREYCSTHYDFDLWGPYYKDIIRWFKTRQDCKTFSELEVYVNSLS